MLNILQDLFGGSSNTTQSTSTSTPSNLNPFTTSLGGSVNALGTSLAGGLPQYAGPTQPAMTDNENSLLGNLMTQNGQGGGAAGTNDYLSGVINGNYLPGQPGGNPFLQQAITAAQRTTMQNLSQTLSRSLPGYFAANGQTVGPNNNGQGGSSAFDTAAALQSTGAANAMGDIASNMESTAYGQERTNQQQAAQLSQQQVSNTINTLQAETLPTMIQQLGISNGMQLFQTNVSGLLQLLQTLGGITSPTIGNTQTSNSSGSMTQQGGIFAPIKLGGGSTPIGGGGGN